MKKSLLVAAGLSAIVAAAAGAQTSCPAGVPTSAAQATANSQQQAADLFQYMAPQLGTALAGGSATLGQTSTVGGPGHFSLGVRATLVDGTLPQVGSFPTCYTGAYRATLPTEQVPVPGATADAAIGVFRGLPLALTNVLGVDLLLSASYLPEFEEDDVSVTLPDGSLKLGYGARVGLLSESIVVPGVSLTVMRRDLPTVDVRAASAQSDSLVVTGLSLKTTSWRLAANKSFLVFGLSAGIGKDKYESSVDTVRASVGAPAPVGRATAALVPAPRQKLDRTNMFVGLSLNLAMFRIAAEIGQASGGEVTTFNTFEGKAADATRRYGSLGIRFGL